MDTACEGVIVAMFGRLIITDGAEYVGLCGVEVVALVGV